MNKKVTINFLLSTTLVLLSLTTTNLFAQTTGTGIFFQAVARDNFANPAKDRKIYVQSSIIQTTATGTKVLTEEYQTTTDATGVFSISVGQGTRIGGTSSNLAGIDWANGPYFLNLKIAITPIAPTSNWDYKNELIDLGTSPFGVVPYALFAGTANGLDAKLSIKDTTSMLAIYAKAQVLKNLESTVNTKIASTDTAAMLAPYKKMVNELIASNITSLTADAINTALNSKVNLVDSNKIYVTPSLLSASAFNPTNINNSLALKANTSDVNTSLALKANAAEVTTALAAKANAADVTTSLASKVDKVTGKELSTNDYTTTEKNKLAAITGANTGDQDLSTYATNTAVALKANTADVTTSLGLKANLASPIFTGTLTAGDVTYPNAHGTNGQVLTTTGTGALTWATPASTANASSLTGVVAVANGGTGQTTVPGILSTLGFSSNNVAIGNLAGTPGIGVNANNVAIGGGAGKTAQGQSSISIGYVAGYANQGVNSLAIGGNAAQSSQGTQAVALGYAAGQNSQGANSVALGAFAGNSQVANSIAINATGANLNPTNAGFYVNPVRATTPTSSLLYYNTSTKEITSGASSGVDLTTAQTIAGIKTFSSDINVNGVKIGRGLGNNDQNVAVGANALSSGTGTRNVAVGYGAMLQYSGTSFDNNTSVGYYNMLGLTTGSANTSMGGETMFAVGSGTNNTAIGNHTLMNSTAHRNTVLGADAGNTITTGTDNTLIGFQANVGTNSLSNSTAIGSGAIVTTSNTIQLGNTSITNVKTSGTITADDVTYPKAHGTNGQVLSTSGSGTLTWITPSTTATAYSGTLPVTNGGTGVTSSTGTGNVVLSSSPTLVTPNIGTPASGVATNLTGLPLTTGVTGTLPVANGGTGVTSSTGTGSVVLSSSPTFTGTVTSPVYASAPNGLTAGSTITWNPSNGLNASVTLVASSTLAFSAAPPAGSTGTLVVEQGNAAPHTLALPTSGTHKVLGSSTGLTLSSVPNSKDIVTFYYDGSEYYWNVGQGYGSDLTSTSNHLAGGASGVLPYQSASGTTAFTSAGTSGQILTSGGYGSPTWTSTTGTGNVVLSSSPTLVTPNIGTPASGVATNLTGLPLTTGVTGTLPVANGGTGVTSSTGTGNVVLSSSPTLVTPNIGTPASGVATNLTGLPLTTGVTGTLPVANGGTGSSTKNFVDLSSSQTISGTKTFNDYLTIASTTSSSSTTSGAFILAGGAGIGGNVYVGGNVNTAGSLTANTASIGTSSPNANAILDLSSTTKGLMLPRLTVDQRDAISSPAEGLTIFNSDAGALEVFAKVYGPQLKAIDYYNGNSLTGGDYAWQAFTPSNSGYLTQIDLKQWNPTNSPQVDFPYKMNIIAGSSATSGVTIGSTIAYIPAGASGVAVSYTFNSPVYLKSGTKYFFRIFKYDSGISSPYADTFMNSSDVYSGHDTNIGGYNQDLTFRLYMKTSLGSVWQSLK
jgi:hypothetical protein